MKEQSIEIMEVTPVLAAKWLKKTRLNRALSRGNVEQLMAALQRGEWKTNNDAICFNVEGNLINGQHRLHAIVNTGMSVRIAVMRDCDTDAFDVMDVCNKARSVADVLSITGVKNANKVAALLNCLHKYLQTGSPTSGIRGLSGPQALEWYRADSDAILETIAKWNHYQKSLAQMVRPAVAQFFDLVFHKVHPNYASEFMLEFTGRKAQTDSPVHALRERLVRQLQDNSTLAFDQEAVAAITIKTWNAYGGFGRGEDALKFVRYGPKREPFPRIRIPEGGGVVTNEQLFGHLQLSWLGES